MFEDKTLVCKDCGREFTFTAGEQAFYAEKGFKNEPTRCKDCRKSRNGRKSQQEKPERELFDVVCAACGAPCKVTFKPSNGKPIYCDDCYRKRRR